MIIRSKRLFIIGSLILLLTVDALPAQRGWVGQDLHLKGQRLISYQLETDEHVLVFDDGVSMSIGANQFSSDRAVIWLETVSTESSSRLRMGTSARVYLEGNVSVEKAKGSKTTDLTETIIEEGQKMVVRFSVSGEVFVTADVRKESDPRRLELYRKALAVVGPVEREFVVQPGAVVPEFSPGPIKVKREAKEVVAKKVISEKKEDGDKKPSKPGLIERVFAPKKAVKPAKTSISLAKAKPPSKKPGFMYPVNIAPMGEVPPKIESVKVAEGADIATVIGRFYLWQKQDEKGGLLELQADSAVVFRSAEQLQVGKQQTGAEDILGERAVKAIYMSGDVVMTEGQRTIRADEIYYDFQSKRAIAVNAVMRNFDVSRGIPIYVRAAKLRQLAENQFAAENITLTSSEFYVPQISFNASTILITDTTTVDALEDKVTDSSYDVQMQDVRLKAGEKTIFYWPFIRSNLERPDVPLKSAHVGSDSTFGTFVETRWYLSRLLGLQEPEGIDSTLMLDYYGKRGFGSGIEIEYTKEDYFGRFLGYVIRDTGEDRLGRNSIRKGLEAPRELRGRVSWLHRQFLPYDWQLTTGIGYSSDENFVEQYYRREFNSGEDETYIHLKRIEDNWAVSLLGKGRINDFSDELEELPGAELHLTGQSLFNDKFTLYNDTQISRLRQRIGNEHTTLIDENSYSFVSNRTELDMPLQVDTFKVVPYIAGTFGYDDRSGFSRTLVDGSNSGEFGDKEAWFGELGVRVSTQYWKAYPNVKSRLWDLDQLRHVLKPQLTAAIYGESDSVVEQRNTLNVGISQRLQTKRGPADNQRTVDWMRLDIGATWVNKSSDVSDMGPGPDRFIWSRPIVPMRVFSAPEIFNGDLNSGLRRFEQFGPRRNYFFTDYIWRISDTSVLMSDCYFDMQSGVVQQLNVGFSRLLWPNLSYYIGSRYLRRIQVLDEKGTNAFTFAATYVLDPRYTLVFAQQFDFDYDANVRSDITLIRRYHRIYCGFTYSADESLDRQAIVFSIWPQGVPELAIGERRYTGLGGSAGY